MLSPGVTKVSKNRHVLRAIRRSFCSSSGTRSRSFGLDGARLVQSAMAGAQHHNKAKTATSGIEVGANRAAPNVAPRPRPVPPAICR